MTIKEVSEKILDEINLVTNGRSNATVKILLDDQEGMIRFLLIINNGLYKNDQLLSIESKYMNLVYLSLYERLKENRSNNKLDIEQAYNLSNKERYTRLKFMLAHSNLVDICFVSKPYTDSILEEIATDFEDENSKRK